MIAQTSTWDDEKGVSVQPIRRSWKFCAADDNGCFYIGPDGQPNSECEWIGTNAEASAEAQRRFEAWENATNGLGLGLVYESQGQVPMKTPEMAETNGLTSADCLLQCSDGKRRVGHYHSNGRWYEHTSDSSHVLAIEVLSWEYL